MKKSVVFFLIFWGLSFLDAQNCSQSEPNTTCYNNYQSTESSVGCAISNANNELLPDLTVSWWMMQEYFINGKFDSGPFEYPSKDRLSVDLFIPNIGNGPMLAIAKGEFVCVNADEEFASDCSLECNTGDCNDASAIVSSVNCNCPEEFQREKVYQRVLVKDGDAMVNYDRFIGYQAFHNDEGHDHFHVDNWIELSLRIKDDTKPSPCDWDIVAESSKIGFCIGDIDWVCTDPNYKCYSDPIPPTPQTDQTNLHDCPEDFPNMNLGGPFAFSNCNNILGQEFANIVERKMGISPGRADFYHKFLTDNWVQIPIGICNKEFWLVAEVNPQNTILEENSSNNCVAIPYQIKYNVDENTNIIENIHKSYCANDNTIELSVQKSSQIYSLKNGAIVTEDDYPGIGLAYDEPYKIDFTWSTNEIAESIVIGLADLDKDSEGEPITTTFTVTASNGNDLLPILENYCNVSVTKQITVSPQDFNEQSQGLTGTDYNAGSFNFTGTHYVAGTIIVNDGCTLNITDAKVHFARESGIIINPGGRINIERSVLTNFPCNDSPWDGIFVNGNALEDHPTTLSSAIHHGVLQINSSIIENAKIGINNWKFYKDTYEAGIVIASNSQFINNGCSIKLTSPLGSNNLSSISRCNFYNMNEFFPNATNVIYSDIAYGHDPANKEYKQIHLKNARNIPINKCQFKSNHNRPIGGSRVYQVTGIFSLNSSFEIGGQNTENQNLFDNLYKGIDVYDHFSILGNKSIQQNLFNNVRNGATLNNGILFDVKNNKFINIPADIQEELQSYGVYAFESFGTNLQSNTFHLGSPPFDGITFYAYGMIIEDSKAINANPNDYSLITENTFLGAFEAGTVFVGENDKIDFDCNQYLPRKITGEEDYIAKTDWALLTNDQGQFELNSQGNCNEDNPDPFTNNWHDHNTNKHIANWSDIPLTISLDYRASDSEPLYVDSDITNTTPDGCEEEGVPCAIEWNELPPPPPPPPSGDCPIHLRSMQKQVNQGLFELVEDELLCPQQDWAYAVLAGTAIAEQNWLTAQSAVDFISLDNNRSVAMKQYFQTLIDGQKESAGKTDFRLAELQDASKASKKTFERSLAQSTIAILKGKSFNRRIKRPTMNKQETILESFHRLINIFPNPTAQPIINIDLQAHDINTESTLVIKSITGRFVKSISLNKDTKQYEIDVSNIQNGLYLIFLEDGNKNIAASGKLVISK